MHGMPRNSWLGCDIEHDELAPVSDWQLGERHRQTVFTADRISGTVIDLSGSSHTISVHTMKPEAVRDMKPSRILEGHLRPERDFPFVQEGGNFYFSYKAQLYHNAALELGRGCLTQRTCVPWFDDISGSEK